MHAPTAYGEHHNMRKLRQAIHRFGFPIAAEKLDAADVPKPRQQLQTWHDYPECMSQYLVQLGKHCKVK